MSLITKIKPFKTRFKTANSIEITEKIRKAAGACSSTRPDFTSYARPNWVTLLIHYEELQKLGRRRIRSIYRYHFTHKAWHSSSETIAKIKYAMIGDPTGALTRNFDNMREDEGLADRATFVVDLQGIIQQSKLPLKALAVTRLTCCVKSKQHTVRSFTR